MKRLTRHILLSLIWLLLPALCLAQRRVALVVKDVSPHRRYTYSCQGVNCLTIAENWVARQHRQGHPLASLDSSTRRGDTLLVWLYQGPRLSQYLHSPQPQPIADSLDREINQLLVTRARAGLPFSSLELDSVAIRRDSLRYYYRYAPGAFLRWDTVRNGGSLPIKPGVLSRLAGVVPGQPYSSQTFNNIYRRLATYPFMQVSGPPSLTFQQDRAVPALVVDHRPANIVNGVIGFLPNEERQGRLTLTGQFQLELYNLLQSAKVLKAHWQRVKANTQQLDLYYQHPVLFGSLITLEGSFNLLREDTLFLTRRARAAASLPFGSAGRIGVSLLNQGGGGQATTTPGVGTFTGNLFGLFAQWNTTIDPWVPRQGFTAFAEVQGGNKRLTSLNGPDPEGAVGKASGQLQATARAQYFSLNKKSWQYVPGASLGLQYNPVILLQNEAYRLGGLATLRGFNENFFIVTKYALVNNELRFYAEQRTWFMAFSDVAWLSNSVPGQGFDQWAWSLGLGFSFATGGGQFQFSYGLGRTQTEGFNLSAAKIHFGFTSRF